MPPPQLPRDAPVVNVAHPLEVRLGVVLRDELHLALLHHLDRPIGQRLDLHEPLRRKPRLDDRLAPVTLAQRHNVVLRADQIAALLQVFDHLLPRFETIQTRVRPGILVHLRQLVHHLDLRQRIAQARFEVVGIVRRRHLHRARSELWIRQNVVGDDRNLAIHQRQQHLLAVQMLVTLVRRIHRHRRIAQHGLRTRRRHDDVFSPSLPPPGSESPRSFRACPRGPLPGPTPP